MIHLLLINNIENDKMCLWTTDAPGSNNVKIWQNLQVLHFDPAPHQGHVMSVKYEEPIDEPTFQV